MDIEKLIDEMDESEKLSFLNDTANNYYFLVINDDFFSNIRNKIGSGDKLTSKEWEIVIKKLFLISYKSLLEEDEIDFFDRTVYKLSKLGIKIALEDSFIYNESFKMIEYVNAMHRAKEINIDLFRGLDLISESLSEADLNVLLMQHHQAYRFRDYKDRFFKSYEEHVDGDVTNEQRISINSLNRAYEHEKELVLQYKSMI